MQLNSIKNIMKYAVCWILLLQMINISIDPPDLKLAENRQGKIEEPATDETETVYELIAEGLFDQDVPENDEEETDTSSPGFLLYFFTAGSNQLRALNFPVEHFSHYQKKVLSAHQEPSSPPPKII